MADEPGVKDPAQESATHKADGDSTTPTPPPEAESSAPRTERAAAGDPPTPKDPLPPVDASAAPASSSEGGSPALRTERGAAEDSPTPKDKLPPVGLSAGLEKTARSSAEDAPTPKDPLPAVEAAGEPAASAPPPAETTAPPSPPAVPAATAPLYEAPAPTAEPAAEPSAPPSPPASPYATKPLPEEPAAPPADAPAPAPASEQGAFQYASGPANARAPYQAPELPPHFVPRAEFFAIKRLVLGRQGASLAPITLHGPDGAGKTALAAALTHDAEVLATFPDGVLWVSLGEEGDPMRAQSIWGAGLGDDLSNQPDAIGRTAALRTLLAERTCLLVIDDVTDIEQVKALNVGGANCVRILTTDRADEISYAIKTRRYSVGKLSENEALDLITHWAGILPDIYLPTVKEIIRRLGNNALALALIGAQARQGITWLRLLEVLRDDQGPIANLNVDDPQVRENALGLVINLVLSRFGGPQLQRLALLGVFAAGSGAPFSVEAAAACWEMLGTESASVLDLAVETALVQRLPADMYALHKSLRDHLRRHVPASNLTEAALRVRNHYLTLVEQGAAASKQIDPQLGQIVSAYQNTVETDPEVADQFASHLLAYFEARGMWANFVRLAGAVVEHSHQEKDLPRKHAMLNDLGFAHTVLGNFGEARDCFERSLMVSEAIGDPAGEAAALNNIGTIYERKGQYVEAETFYSRSMAIRQKLGTLEDIAAALVNVAGVQYAQSRWDDAQATFQRVLDIAMVLNDRHLQAQTELNIGAVYENMGSDWEALQTYQRSLAIYSNLDDEEGQAQALNNLGIVYLNQGDTERALAHFKRSLAFKEKTGDRPGQALTLNNIALLYEKTSSPSLALENYEQAYAILKSLDDTRAAVVAENIEKLKSGAEKKKKK